MHPPSDPSRILQLGEGFMASKTLLSAVELELFTKLSGQALTGGRACRPAVAPSSRYTGFADKGVEVGASLPG